METSMPAVIIFEPEYRDRSAVKGLDGFSHIWVLWEFSKAERDKWSPTVRPPRFGGNRRMGVFATRSPFRPNAIGLSSLKLEKIEYTAESGPVLHVTGADMLDMTPIYDIKPLSDLLRQPPLTQCPDLRLSMRITGLKYTYRMIFQAE